MRKIILLTFITFMMVACTEKDSNSYIGINIRVSTIDSCEYVKWGNRLAHKGNCRFCKERRQKEMKELVEQIRRTL